MMGQIFNPVSPTPQPFVSPSCQALPSTGPGQVGPADSHPLQPVHWSRCRVLTEGVLTKEVLDDGLVVFPEVAEGPPA